MADINSLQLTGRLAKDPYINENKDGSKKINMTLAVSASYKDSDGKAHVDYIDVETFISKERKSIGGYEFIKKGTRVGVTGRLRQNIYTDKNNKTVYKQVVVVDPDGLHLLDSRSKGTGTAAAAASADVVPIPTGVEDAPFTE